MRHGEGGVPPCPAPEGPSPGQGGENSLSSQGSQGPTGYWRASLWPSTVPQALRGRDLGTCQPWHRLSRVPLLPLLATAASCPLPPFFLLPVPPPAASPWLLLTSVLLDCPSSHRPFTHLFPLSGLRKAERGWVPPGLWAPQAETSGPLPRCQPSGNPSPPLGGRGDSTQRVKALGGRGWARSWAAPLKEGAGAGNSHPTSPPTPRRALPHPSQPAPPRGPEESLARPLSVQVSRPCSGSGDQAPGAARRPRIGQGSERA